MNRFDFYKELYFKEIERQEFVNNSLTTPLSILSGLIVAIFILATTFSYESSRYASYLFLAVVFLSLIPIGFTVYFLAIAFVNKKGLLRLGGAFEYKYLALTSNLLSWQKSVETHFRTYYTDSLEIQNLTDQAVEDLLIEQLTQFTDINIESNDAKSANIYNAKKFLIYSIVVSFVTVFPYSYALYHKPNTVYKLSLANDHIKVPRITEQHLNRSIMPETPENSPRPPAETPNIRVPIPPPPPGRLIKEGERPKPQTEKKR